MINACMPGALALAVLIGASLVVLPPNASANDDARLGLERQILVTLPQSASANRSVARRKPYQRSYKRGPSSLNRSRLNNIARQYSIKRVEGWLIRSLAVYCEVYLVPENLSVQTVVTQLNRDSRVSLAQPMHVFRTLATEYDDPYFSMQSAAEQLQLVQAHRSSTGDRVSIAIIDSGVDAAHPEFSARIKKNHDVVGDERKHSEIHGTAVAGIIASAVNNGQGIVGVAPDADIAALRACWQEHSNESAALCSTFTLAQALELALQIKPGIINMSLAGPEDPLLLQLVEKALARRIIIVAAIPDDADDINIFPASVRGVIVARAPSVHPSDHSDFQLYAPGEQIITTAPDNNYTILSGNSLAAAHVTGVIALMLQQQPKLTTAQIASYLFDSTPRGAKSSINACRALRLLQSDLGCDNQAADL